MNPGLLGPFDTSASVDVVVTTGWTTPHAFCLDAIVLVEAALLSGLACVVELAVFASVDVLQTFPEDPSVIVDGSKATTVSLDLFSRLSDGALTGVGKAVTPITGPPVLFRTRPREDCAT